ncbi:methionyl-tRNA formyltransferase [Corynebacterium bovis]|uniref:Methionyl-tRNA formyltransferase n=1 Tax=Corynebacterium bovis TaxID=36808 RepID=A0A426Q3T1_9CORY|nr:methionyl-tRNA formyltransferase [Corynebacterium bovis]RRO92522.1 methionyl-tRNA formyltransferase [Corynebacterium bovis]RRO94625.1 methionyl-tRNA formyltransferase [Corynebacterium bovis]RRO95384.1 methionyl-tRNA formyltransferase [Corynebacterium bovis]RRO99871.1 methionyl-tRNA formyltransferase [Corynebacterium bovis]RRQ00400.1 methionyl-tRNA formyltransferase [Corynebacterium bovis]
MRVALFGFQTWGHRTLSAIIGAGHEVVLVVTHPKSDHPYEQMWSDSVEDLARDNGIPVHVTARADDAALTALREADPEVIVANNWRTWLPPEIFDLPRHGALNVHDGLLPHYAGFSPILWALLNRESHVGVTVHRMDATLDGGPVIAQQAIPVGPTDTTTTLVEKTVDLIEPLIVRALEGLADGTLTGIEQDPTRATYFHKRGDHESRIDFTAPAEDVELLIRAQSDPYPNAHFDFRGQRVRALSAHVSRGRFGGTPGRVTIPHEGGVAVVCGSPVRNAPAPAIVLETLRLDDGSEVPATEFFGTRGGYIRPTTTHDI